MLPVGLPVRLMPKLDRWTDRPFALGRLLKANPDKAPAVRLAWAAYRMLPRYSSERDCCARLVCALARRQLGATGFDSLADRPPPVSRSIRMRGSPSVSAILTRSGSDARFSDSIIARWQRTKEFCNKIDPNRHWASHFPCDTYPSAPAAT
jgi:hypothetical protein